MAPLFSLLFFLIPLVFYPKTSEVFEFNKMLLTYSFATIIIFAWIVKMIGQKKIIFRRTILDIPLLLFIGSQLVSTLISIDIHTSILGYYSRFNGGLVSTLTYALLYWAYVSNINWQGTKKIIISLLASATIVSLWAILEHFGYSLSCLLVNNKFDASCWIQDVQIRVFASLGQPNWLAAFLVAVSPLAWEKILTAQKGTSNRFLIIIPFLFFGALLFSKSRSGLLGFLVANFIFWSLSLWRNRKSYLKKFLTFGFFFNSIFLILILIFGTPWTPKITDFIDRTSPEKLVGEMGPALETGGTESGEIRKIVWQGAVNIWKAYPLFGTGVETFAFSYYQFRPQEHNLVSEWDFLYNKAHNEYLNLAATTGTFGLLTYSSLIFFSLVSFFQFKKPIEAENYKLKIALLAGYFSILVTNFFGFSVVITSLLFFLYPAMANSSDDKNNIDAVKKLTSSQKIGILVAGGFTFFLLYSIANYWRADFIYAQSKAASREGNLTKAVENLEKAIQLQPNEAVYRSELANNYQRAALLLSEEEESTEALQLAELALEESEMAITLSPRNILIRKGRINILSQLSLLDKSLLNQLIKELEELRILAPTDPKIPYFLGLNYNKLGQKAKAIAALQEAIKLKFNYEDPQKLLQKLENDLNL